MTDRPVREERRPAREAPEEVAAGILRIQLPIALPGLGHVNCYAMEDDLGVTLVDPGLPGPKTWHSLKKKLATVGLPINRVHTVVVTHSHPDHFGQAAAFRRRVGADILTHRAFRTFLDPDAEADDEEPLSTSADAKATVLHHTPTEAEAGPLAQRTPWGGTAYQLPLARRMRYRLMRFAAGRFITTPTPTRRVEDAQVVELGGREWISVHTPGHTRDHLCLYDPVNELMLSGDHVLPTITPHISGLGETVDPLADFFQSLDRMQTFDRVKTVLPAHGLDFADLASRAGDIKRHHHERLQTLRESSEEIGAGTVTDYMRALFQERSWGSMAESETYAHLEHLRFLGEAAVDDSGSALRYRFS